MTAVAKPHVFAKFIDKPILKEDGRLVYALLNAFALAGHRVFLFDNVNYREVGPLGPMIYSIDGVQATTAEPPTSEDTFYLFDREDARLAGREWKKKIEVKFDVFSNYAWARYRGYEPVVMPYPMHPWNYGNDLQGRLQAARNQERKMRIFFSGDTKGYKRNRIFYPSAKLTRVQIIDTILQAGSPDTTLVADKETLDDVLHGIYRKQCVIVDMSKVFVEDWLNNLGKAEFFICPPGYVMPMCHNTVEAIAVGTIPIINYPEWFRPSLRHLETCIAFDDEADLLLKVAFVLQMDAGDVARMRRNVIDYYRQHLDPVVFAREVEAKRQRKVTVLMITDRCVVTSAPKLNRNSILIRDEPSEERGGIGILLSTVLRDRRAP